MNRVEKFISIIRKHWITAWLIVAVVSFGAVLSYAKFKVEQDYVKRVISARSDDNVLFTSNYLKANEPKYPNSVPTGSSHYYDVFIYNYDRTNRIAYYTETINYTLTAKLKKNNGDTAYDAEADATDLTDIFGDDTIRIYRLTNNGSSVVVSDEPIMTPLGKNTVSASIEEHLAPDPVNGINVNKYRVFLPACVIDEDVYVELTAEPDNYEGLPELIGGYFFLKTNDINLTTAWVGALNDDQSIPISGYDGFNYSITGNGYATKYLVWDKSLVEPNIQEISELFGKDLTDTNDYHESGNIRYIEVDLDSSTNGGRYDIQFYVSGTNSSARSTLNSMSWTGSGGLESKIQLADTAPF